MDQKEISSGNYFIEDDFQENDKSMQINVEKIKKKERSVLIIFSVDSLKLEDQAEVNDWYI